MKELKIKLKVVSEGYESKLVDSFTGAQVEGVKSVKLTSGPKPKFLIELDAEDCDLLIKVI